MGNDTKPTWYGAAPLPYKQAIQILGVPSGAQPLETKQTARQRTPVKIEVSVEVARGFGKELAVA
jgi:hypothetical protein